jgi:hypothetical protein
MDGVDISEVEVDFEVDYALVGVDTAFERLLKSGRLRVNLF